MSQLTLAALDSSDVTFPSVPGSTGVFQVWSLQPEDVVVSYKIKVTHPSCIRTSPSAGSLLADGAQLVQVELLNTPTAEEMTKMKLLVVFTNESGKEEKVKVPVILTFQSEGDGEIGTAPPPAADASEPNPPAASPVVESAPPVAGEPSSPAAFQVSLSLDEARGAALQNQRWYWIEIKRSGMVQTGPAVECQGDSVRFNTGSGPYMVSITGCQAEYRADGTPLRRLLTVTLLESLAPDGRDPVEVGVTRFDTTECDDGDKSADVPLKGVAVELLGVCLSMRFERRVANTHKPAEAEPVRPSYFPSQEPSPSSPSYADPSGSPSDMDLVMQRIQSRGPPPKLSLQAKANPPPTGSPASPAGGEPLRKGPGGAGANPLGEFSKEQSQSQPALSSMETNVRVFVRIRPKLHFEQDRSAWKILSDESTLQDDEGHSYALDRILPPTMKNPEVYQLVGPQLIDGLLNGINGTLFMYGQTASGKTHTVFGTNGEPGLCLLVIDSLFNQIASMRENAATEKISVFASFFEIYNEELNDLLDPSRKNVSIRSGGKDGAFIADVHSVEITDGQTARRILKEGTENKHMGQSVLNDRSSRSHSIFQLKVRRSVANADRAGQRRILTAELNLVDLAGSETLSEKGDSGQKKETSHINLSLTYLKKVIKELADKASFVSYRNSSLTKILKQSLGGNSRTILICCATAAHEHKKDTRNTLIFATTAKTVTTTVSVNSTLQGGTAMKEELNRLRKELEIAQDALKYYEGVEQDLKVLQSINLDLRRKLTESENLRERDRQQFATKGSNDQGAPSRQQEVQPSAYDEVFEEVAYEEEVREEPGSSGADIQQREPNSQDRREGEDNGEQKVSSSAVDGGAFDEVFEEVEEVVDDGAPSNPPAAARPSEDGAHQDNAGSTELAKEESQPPAAPRVLPGKKRPPPPKLAGKGITGTQIEEVQKLRQQLIQAKLQHREEMLAKEGELRAALADQMKASDEVSALIEKEQKISTLLNEIHRFLFYGTAVTVVSVDEKRKELKAEEKWLSYIPNSKGEISIALYEVRPRPKQAVSAPNPNSPSAPAVESQEDSVEPDRSRLIEKHHLEDCKRVVLGLGEEFLGKPESYSNATDATKILGQNASKVSFSLVFRKKQFIHVTTKDSSDFEAWVIDLNKQLKTSANWSKPLDLSRATDVEKLSSEEKEFCATMNITPSEFLFSKERIAFRRDRFITLFDVRSLTRLDLYHSQKFFHFLRCQAHISQATLFYLTDKFAESLAMTETPGSPVLVQLPPPSHAQAKLLEEAEEVEEVVEDVLENL